ncbi:uncharacterized protein [Miscanthus floridulus]|uniref:uncharacterized protein isoform X2 n=1 Tax=Miscanthus floridulus TaxID=154761 RepID=UPI00345AB158
MLRRVAIARLLQGVHPNGQEVAVKKLYNMPGLDEDQFQNELRILTRICHPNIVQLVGKSYIEQDRCVEHQGRLVFATKIERAICLEFLPKGSLEKHLSDEWSGLCWHSRYKIIKGICDGLQYLHGERIFHLDLKPSNILLDKDMVPKIADFGLSRLFSGTRQSHTTKNLLGTLGYAPPEYVDMGKITKKFDVFSLGVIIIKILTGSDGYSTYSDMCSSQDFIDLLQVQRNWRNMLLMAAWKDASYLDAYCNQVKTCTEIAVKCVESNSHKRPSIEDVISMLNQTEETIDKLYRQLFVVQPLNLCFPFEPDKLIPCPVQLTNNADHHITYRIQPNTPDIFVGSLNGTVPARSTQTYILTMQKQQKPPPNLSTIHIQSVAANLDLSWDIDYMFHKAEAVHDVLKQVKITSLRECASQLAFKPRIEVSSLNRTYRIDIHPLEPWVLIISGEGEARGIEIWNCRTRAKLDLSNKLPPIKGVIEAKFIARKQWLVAVDWDGYIHVYCYKAMQQLAHFKAHRLLPLHLQSWALAVHPTEPYVMSFSLFESNVKLWNWEKGWECTRIFEFVDKVYGVTLNVTDTDTFAVHGDAGIKVCSHRSAGSAEFILSEYNDPVINCFDYFANGGHHYLIIGGTDGIVKIRELHTKSLVQTVEGIHLDSVDVIYCHHEHPVLVTGSADGTVCLWNPTTLRPERTFNCGLRRVNDVQVCMDSSRSYKVVIAHRNGLAMIEIDQNDLVVVDTGSSSEENGLVGSRKRKLSEPDQPEIENEENDFVVDVMDTGNGAEQTQGNGSTDEEIHSVSSNLLDVYPGKLQLPFKPNKLTSCSVKLRNTTDDHIAVRLLTKCPKRYMAKMPLCCIVPPNCMYTFIVTGSDQKKRPLLSRDEFLTLESTICLKEDIVGLQNANVDSAAMEFTNFFKEAKEMAADKQVHELKLSVVSDPLKETTSVQQQPEVEVVSNRKFSHVLSVDVHPTEPWILTTNQAGEVRIWDYKAQAIAISFDFTQKQVYSAKFIVGEEWIVAGDGYGTIYVYSYQTEEEVTNIDAHDSDITSLAVHPTDPLVLSSSEDRLIKLWDWKKNWECTRTFEGHSDRVTLVNFNPIGTSSFVSASLDHTIKVWNISSLESIITTLSDHPDGLVCIHSYRSDMKQYLIAGSCDGTAQIWDMETRRLVQTLKGHARHISCVYHHPELPVVITGSHDGTVRLWNSTTYRLESIVGINLGVVHALGYIKDLRRIAIGCRKGIAIMGVNYS